MGWCGMEPPVTPKLMGQLAISLPAYLPELNPAERVQVRRHIEGEVYPSLEAKRSAIEHLLRQLKADKPRLKRLIGWDWLQRALAQLPNA